MMAESDKEFMVCSHKLQDSVSGDGSDSGNFTFSQCCYSTSCKHIGAFDPFSILSFLRKVGSKKHYGTGPSSLDTRLLLTARSPNAVRSDGRSLMFARDAWSYSEAS